MKSCRNFSQRTCPIHWTLNLCFGVIRTIWVDFGPFDCLTKIDAKRAVLVPKFVPRSRVGIFRNERTRSTLLDPKLMFWCVSYYLGAFGTVWLPYETRCKTGRTSAKVRATKSRRNFSQRTLLIHPIGPDEDITASDAYTLKSDSSSTWTSFRSRIPEIVCTKNDATATYRVRLRRSLYGWKDNFITVLTPPDSGP